MKGYISLHRQIMEHWLWPSDRPYTELEAWIYLLLSAAHTRHKKLVGGNLVVVEVGEVLTSERQLSEVWKWDRKRVRKFLSLLEADFQISVQKNGKNGTSLKVTKYAAFQGKIDTERTAYGTSKGTSEGTSAYAETQSERLSADPIIRVNNENNGNKNIDELCSSDPSLYRDQDQREVIINSNNEDQGSWSEEESEISSDPDYLNEETNRDNGDPDHEVKKKQTKKPQKFSEEAKALAKEFRAMLESQGISYFERDWHLKSGSSCNSLLKMGVTPDEIRHAMQWFLADEWHRKNAVDFTYIKKNFGRFQAAKNQPSTSTPTKIEYKRDCNGRYTRGENGDPAQDPDIRFRELDEGAQTRRLLAKGSIDPNTRQPVWEKLHEDNDLVAYVWEQCRKDKGHAKAWGPKIGFTPTPWGNG